jgi:hypothetical protein
VILAPAILVAAIAAAATPPPAPPPPVGVTRVEMPGAVRIDAVLPGRLLSYALPVGAGGRREIVMLVAPGLEPPPPEPENGSSKPAAPEPCDEVKEPDRAADLPRILMRLDLTEAGGTLTTLRDDLPSDAVLLDAIDLDGDGVEEILLGRPGALLALRDTPGRRAGGGPDLLLSDPDLPREPGIISFPAAAGAPFVALDILGGVRFYGPRERGGGWGLLYEAALPVKAQSKQGSFRLESGRVRIAGRKSDGAILYASGPEAVGAQRLRTLLFDPMAAGEARRIECWSMLPDPEQLLESDYLILDGRPALVVTTRPADKLSLFGEKLLRLFLLDDPDRSRRGASPLLAAQSGMNLWQGMDSVVARDVNGDGRDDLLVGYWKGLTSARVALDVYLRREDGSFDRSAVTTDFDVKEGNKSVLDYHGDLDGDGRADLLLAASDKVLVFPGSSSSRGGRNLVEKEPRWSVPVNGSMGTPHPLDLDGDGRAELLVAQPQEKGRGLLQVIRLTSR